MPSCVRAKEERNGDGMESRPHRDCAKWGCLLWDPEGGGGTAPIHTMKFLTDFGKETPKQVKKMPFGVVLSRDLSVLE